MTSQPASAAPPVLLGSLAGGHGVKGWVKVHSWTQPMEAILDYSPWLLCQGSQMQEAKVLDGRQQGKRLLAHLEGVADRTQADALSGWEIRLPQARLPALAAGDFYWFQLQGLAVKNMQGQLLGQVARLLETGANDVLVVQPTAGSLDDAERLIPYVRDSIVQSVELDAGEIRVDWGQDY